MGAKRYLPAHGIWPGSATYQEVSKFRRGPAGQPIPGLLGPGWSLRSAAPVLTIFFFFFFSTRDMLQTLEPCPPLGSPIRPASLQSLDGNRWQRIPSGSVWASLIDKTGGAGSFKGVSSFHPSSCPAHVPVLCPVLACPGAVWSAPYDACSVQQTMLSKADYLPLPLGDLTRLLPRLLQMPFFGLAWPGLASLCLLVLRLHGFDHPAQP